MWEALKRAFTRITVEQRTRTQLRDSQENLLTALHALETYKHIIKMERERIKRLQADVERYDQLAEERAARSRAYADTRPATAAGAKLGHG